MIASEDVAVVCHEANRTYCMLLGDLSQASWPMAEQWQRASAILGVEFRRANPASTPAMLHENWMTEKIRDGWVHGLVKNAEAREHPCLVPYDALPEAQRRKDALFAAIVDALSVDV